MRVAIDTSLLQTDHRGRGIGFYTEHLISSLRKHKSKLTVTELTEELDDVDIVHYPHVDFFRKKFTFDKRCKTVVTIHDLIPLKFPKHFPVGIKGKLNWMRVKRQLKNVNAIITVSNNSKQDIISIIGIEENKVNVVYSAAGEEFKVLSDGEIAKSNLNRKYDIPNKYLLYVGDVNWNKNVKGLIRAYSKLKSSLKFKDLKLVLVGKAFDENSKELKEIQTLIKQLKLENEVVQLKFVPVQDLVGIYNSANVYVQPSFYEGFGFPVLEAMSCGVQVACSNRSSLPEIAGNAAVYFNPCDNDEMAKTIKKLLELTSRQKKTMVTKAQAQAKQFSWRKTASDTVNIYAKVLKKKND